MVYSLTCGAPARASHRCRFIDTDSLSSYYIQERQSLFASSITNFVEALLYAHNVFTSCPRSRQASHLQEFRTISTDIPARITFAPRRPEGPEPILRTIIGKLSTDLAGDRRSHCRKERKAKMMTLFSTASFSTSIVIQHAIF